MIGEVHMSDIRLKAGAWVLIGDGRKALLAVNAGTALAPDLHKLEVTIDTNPPTHEQGSDAPGRAFSSGGMRSAVGATDWHMLEEHRFAAAMAERINRAASEKQFKEIVVVAPPKILADLRQAFSGEAKKRIVAEIAKDLTKHPFSEITRIVTGAPK
jgi:protein required for attachment to host cells